MGACHSRVHEIGFGHCGEFPPDPVPLPSISVRDSIDAPGVIVVTAFAGRRIVYELARVDTTSVSSRTRARFPDVVPGAHHLRVRAIGFRGRDTIITMPRGSGLIVDVPVTRGGMSHCEDGVYYRPIPWWKFWERSNAS